MKKILVGFLQLVHVLAVAVGIGGFLYFIQYVLPKYFRP